MATGMQPKELGINYLVLCENPESFIKIHDYACQTWVGGYRELLLKCCYMYQCKLISTIFVFAYT